MIALARLADKGPGYAAMVAVSLFMSGLAVTLLGAFGGLFTLALLIASSAIISYVTLRRGLPAAVRTIAYSTIALTVFSIVLFSSVLVLPAMELLMWLPVLLPAVVLLRTVSLNLALTSVVGIGAFFVVLVSLTPGLMEGIRDQLLESVTLLSAAQGAELDAAQLKQLERYLADNIAVFMGISAMFTPLASLLLGRWWHAAAVNPGGFRQEFHSLQFGRTAALGCVGIVVLAMVFDSPLWSGFAAVTIVAFILQGLSVCHALIAQRGLNRGWLVGVYLLTPLSGTMLLLGALGLVDNFRRLRRIDPADGS